MHVFSEALVAGIVFVQRVDDLVCVQVAARRPVNLLAIYNHHTLLWHLGCWLLLYALLWHLGCWLLCQKSQFRSHCFGGSWTALWKFGHSEVGM